MPRIQRIMNQKLAAPGARFDANQPVFEAAFRGRVGRRVRTALRRMEPVLLTVPRWSQPERFLEDLALDLAIGQPGIGCRTVDLSPLKGHGANEAWRFTLHLFAQMGQRDWQRSASSMVAHRSGFRYALSKLLFEAHAAAPHPVALLAHGAQYLPVEIIEDLRVVWADYWRAHPFDARCTLLLATAVGTDLVGIDGMQAVDLMDFGAAEAMRCLATGADLERAPALSRAMSLTGGIPGLVDAVRSLSFSRRALATEDDALVYGMGELVDALQGAVDIANMDSALSDRLHQILDGQPRPWQAEVDEPLRIAGLVRTYPSHGDAQVVLRAPAIATLLE
jgi:hypothetical protein